MSGKFQIIVDKLMNLATEDERVCEGDPSVAESTVSND